MHAKNKIKGLFVAHDIRNYGAFRSLQLLLKNYQYVDIDFITKKLLFNQNPSIENIRSRFGSRVKNVMQLYLPFDYCYKHKPETTWKLTVFKLANRLVWKLTKRRFYDVIEHGNYDFIHLNSLVLHPVITERYPFFIHIREIYDGTNQMVFSNVQKAKGVLFIDDATREPFAAVPLRRSIVLNNPFDMTMLAQFDHKQVAWPEPDLESRVVFSMIGAVTEQKGVDFVISTFMELKNSAARLLVVGSADTDGGAFFRQSKRLAERDPRIIFMGEIEEIARIYAISDFILRGEEYQCIGRTIYEGLFAGCGVIVPADKSHMKRMFDYERFKDKIFFYTPRNGKELLALFERLSQHKVTEKVFASNISDYIKQFHEFVMKESVNE